VVPTAQAVPAGHAVHVLIAPPLVVHVFVAALRVMVWETLP
jgi:hypothetical protein